MILLILAFLFLLTTSLTVINDYRKNGYCKFTNVLLIFVSLSIEIVLYIAYTQYKELFDNDYISNSFSLFISLITFVLILITINKISKFFNF